MMKLFNLRNTMVMACAVAALSACGGKETYPINVIVPNSGTIDGVVYGPLVLKETVSGQTLSIADNSKTLYTFPNTVDYGDAIDVTIVTEPLHQLCKASTGSASAGQRERVEVQVICMVDRHSVLGSVTVDASKPGKIEGLELINGSDNSTAQKLTATTTAYEFASLKYGSSYTIGILKQPVGTTCRFVLPATQPAQDPIPTQPTPLPQLTATAATGRIPDGNVEINIVCAAN